ncbi:SGNH/GDSL hydrolase family protein [Curtobacterium sp. MCBD17_030]|uniref:SGNH/GDSL hydrolase family protein n=1 Tax=Curtobacterium sp. MCBD17_030 TaxID=2175649 RepID=UPI0015E8A115|nr:SGNH/GDSL hydrolase family protein [Curtobacterium sp. MCBD17_030]
MAGPSKTRTALGDFLDAEPRIPDESTVPSFLEQWQDGNGRMPLGIKTDGTVQTPLHDSTRRTVGPDGTKATDYVTTGWVAGPDGTPLASASTDGTKVADDALGTDGRTPGFVLDGYARRFDKSIFALAAGLTPPVPAGLGAMRGRDGSVRFATSRTDTIVCLGDSITFGYGDDLSLGGWPGRVGATTGKTMVNLGTSGWTSTEKGIHWGAIVPLLTLAGNQLAVSGSTAVTAVTPSTTYRQGASGVTTSWHGTLLGIPCTLAHDTTKSQTAGWTITPDAALPQTLTVPAGAPFIPDVPTLGGSPVPSDAILITALGVNDFPVGSGAVVNSYLDTARDAVASLSRLTPTNPKYLVVSIINTTTQTRGTVGYQQVSQANDELRRLFGSQFADVRGYMIANAISYLTAQGVTPTAADTAAVAGDTVPPSLRTDSTHPNGLGYNLYAQAVQSFLTEKGW